MDWMQKIGGRKFLIALLAIGAGMYLEIAKAGGLSVNMAGLLVGLVGAFSVANSVITGKHFDFKSSGDGDSSDAIGQMSKQITDLTKIATAANDQENVNKLAALLSSIHQSIEELKGTTGQVGTLMVNVGKDVQSVKKAVSQPLTF